MIIKCLIFSEKCTTATNSSTFTLQMKFWSDYGLGRSRVGVGKNWLVGVVQVHLSLNLLLHNLSFKLLSDSLWTVFLGMNAYTDLLECQIYETDWWQSTTSLRRTTRWLRLWSSRTSHTRPGRSGSLPGRSTLPRLCWQW